MTNNNQKETYTLPLRFHPFSENDYKGIGDYIIVPQEVIELKGKDGYKEALDEIVERLKDRVAEETKKYMTVVIRNGKDDLHTVGVKIFVLVGEKNGGTV